VKRVVAAGAVFVALLGWVTGAALLADGPAARAQEGRPFGFLTDSKFIPPFPTRQPFHVLAIGSDARPGVCEPVERCLADSIHLISVNPRQGGATIIGIPRDSYVEVPGHGSAKINDSLFLGGPELVVETVEALADVEIDMYFLTSFEGFRHMVEEIGGIEVEVPYPMSDEASGAVFEAGPRTLTGREALAFSRNRKDTPNGDFSRTENQGLVILGALQQFQQEARRDPGRIFEWLRLGAKYIQTDLTLSDLFDLALATLRLDPDQVTNVPVPGGIGMIGGASVVTLGSEADALFADVAEDAMVTDATEAEAETEIDEEVEEATE
jgi:LCP family protein required for cell wall assembly